MRVKIGKYKHYFGPFQLAEFLCFWAPRNDAGDVPDWVDQFGDWLQHGRRKGSSTETSKKTRLYYLLNWIYSKRHQRVKVKIHDYDIWSMDNTLAHIILPMLHKIVDSKQGVPFVDDQDVPQEITITSAGPHEPHTVDEHQEARWNYVLSEMIFSFDSLVGSGKEWEDQFFTGVSDWVLDKSVDGWNTLEHGPNHTQVIDLDGIKVYQERIQNGFRLFGKYYQNLWT